MCGIAGCYHFGSQSPESPATIEGMLQSIHHRGPDDHGVFAEGPVTIGMRRLSIIDLAGGHQPITNEDGSVVLVFNGEIYNYQELTAELRQRGHRFATSSDTETVVHLYEEYGEDCVHHLRGMFGFALWDARRGKLLIARDRLGIKPLYYALNDDHLIFGSEIKAILAHPGIRPSLDLNALSNFLSLKYVPAPQTMFEGIRALRPGYLMVCTESGVTERQYWDVQFRGPSDPRYSEAEYAERLEELLRESVRMHLISDVPFGAFLSGGVDSSTIVALMSETLEQPVKTFSVGFTGEGANFSELPYARLVAQRYQTDHHEVFIGPEDFMNLAEKIVWHLDQPIGDEASLANYMVADLASKHVKMVLTGEGGDELFAGYARYAGERFAGAMQRVPAPVRSLGLGALSRLPGLRRPKIAMFALCQTDEVARMTDWFPLFNRDHKVNLLSAELKGELVNLSADRVFAEQLQGTTSTDSLHRMLYVDTKLWLPDDLLARGDKTSMAASIEGRVPLLDHKLVEFAATVPSDLKLKGLTRKYLLKKVAQAWLPPEIINRKKQGFPMPMSLWFRNEAREFVRDHLAPQTIRQRGLFNPDVVTALLDEHDAEHADHGSLIWGLLNVELWHRVFLDQHAGQPSACHARLAGATTPPGGARFSCV